MAADRVLIAGGGLAGLATGYQLSSRGVNVALFEARRAIGGRTRSRQDIFPPHTLELGAEFIGGNHPRWLAYAETFGIELAEIDWPETSWVQLDGQVIVGERLRVLKNEYRRLTDQLTGHAQSVNDEQPWLTPHAEQLDRTSLADAIAHNLHGDDLAKRLLMLRFQQSEAAPSETISWLGQLTVIKGHGLNAYWDETEKYCCPGGVEQLAKAFAARLPAGAIHTDSVVSQISFGEHNVSLQLSDGNRFEGSWLVLAIPPSQWARIRFHPPLPLYSELRLGAASKEFMLLSKPFWKPGPAPLVLCEEPRGGLMQTALDRGPDEPVCLTWYVAGRSAETLQEMSPGRRQQRLHDALKERLPSLAQHWTGWHAQDWVSEPFADGAYSFAQLGKVTTWGRKLYYGLGRLLFAGEHASFRYTGYMEGALESAQRASARILETQSPALDLR